MQPFQLQECLLIKIFCFQFKGWNQPYHQPVLKFPRFFPACLQAKTVAISKLVDDKAGSILQTENKISLCKSLLRSLSYLVRYLLKYLNFLQQSLLFIFYCFFSIQMKEHEKALRIFVHNIGDFAEAEQYCNQITLDQPRREKETLLLLFLTVLLDTAATKR